MIVLATPTAAGGRVSQKEINVIGTMQLLAACQKATSAATIASILQFGSPALSLTDEQIRGHSRWLNFVTTIPLANIDLAKSRAALNSRLHWLAWDYRIYATNGKAISISRFAFEPKQFEQMLDAISAQQKDVEQIGRE